MKLTQKIVREFLDYNPQTGELRWKHRARKWFKTTHAYNTWNSKYVGKLAFTHSNPPMGHKRGAIFCIRYYAHQIIWLWMTGNWPIGIDHENHNPADNCWVNIKEKTQTGNLRNQSLSKANTSGHTGVVFFKRDQNWHAQIKVNQKIIHLGYFDTFEEAVIARKAAEQKYDFHPNHGKLL